MTQTQNNKRIAKNTLMLYIRMFLMMAVTIYTSRVVLDVLGVEDYGIYNVVGGVVTSLSLVTNSLSAAISRFITFELGRKENSKINEVFNTSINVLLILSIIVLIIGEILGVWFLNNYINIPIERLDAANWIFHFSLITFIIRLLTIPYNALIIAHERMNVYAYMSLFEVILLLLIVFLLKLVSIDNLILYGFLIMCVAFIVTSVYKLYCKKNFKESYYTFSKHPQIFKEMLNFTGWNFIGASAGVLRIQGIDVIANLFFGVTVNAARGIASQVSNAVYRFSDSFTTALHPQLIKSYAEGDNQRLILLIKQGSKYSFYLLMLLVLPIIFEIDTILALWLKKVPQQASIFSVLQMIDSLMVVLSITLMRTMFATGKIRNYQIIVGGVSLCSFPLSYIFLCLGFPASVTYVVDIVIEFTCLVSRLFIVRKYVDIQPLDFLENVVLRAFLVIVLASIVPFIIVILLPENVYRLIITFLSTSIWSLFIIYFLGLKKDERKAIKTIAIRVKSHLFH